MMGTDEMRRLTHGVYETTASQRVLAQADKFAAERNGNNEQ